MKDREKNKKLRLSEWEAGLRVFKFFEKMFADTSPEGERRFILFCKKVLFLVVFVVELLLVSQYVERWVSNGEWIYFVINTSVIFMLTTAQVLSLFVLSDGRWRKTLYFLQTLGVCLLLAFAEGSYALLLYILMLTQLYLDMKSGRFALWTMVGALLLYAASYTAQVFLTSGGTINLFDILRDSVGSLAFLVLHFLAVQFVMSFYRQYLQLNRTFAELDESKKELEKALEVVAEISALEERQRIAKDIHDTAGHSLTTVIMQTESAKRMLENDPDEARKKIIAANLQAKTTLERLRESVHLLSGATEGMTLKGALEAIIHESTDGTGINIRAEIADTVLSSAKNRFLCNALREGVSNGLRHGNATAFWFELKRERDKIHFLLSDNGKGLSADGWQEGFGLSTMRERARSLGGEVEFISEPEEGFEIRIILPADEE